MITAIIIDHAQIESIKQHLENCQELGAQSAILFLANKADEVKDMNRVYEEWSQGDPPMRFRAPDVAYMGPSWVIGVAQDADDTLNLLTAGRKVEIYDDES